MKWITGVKRSLLLAGLLASQLAMAQSDALAKKVDLYLKDADLLSATQALTLQTGIQFIIEPSSEPFVKINLSLAGVTAEDAIKYICQAAGGTALRDENGVFVIRRGKPTTAAEPAKADPVAAPPKPRALKRIPIMHADPRYLHEYITKGRIIDHIQEMQEVNTYMNSLRMGVQMPQQAPVALLSGNGMQYAYPQASSQQNVQSGPQSGGVNDVMLPGESAPQFGGPGGGFGGAGGGGFGAPGGGQFGGGGAGGGLGAGQGGPGGGQGGALTGGQGLVPDGIDWVYYDPTTNSFIVRGTQTAIDQLRTIINELDKAPAQVIVKVEFVTTRKDTSKSLGFDWLYQRGTIVTGNEPGSFAKSSFPFVLSYGSGNITSRVRAAIQEGGGRVVQAPLIRTLNNQFAAVTFSSTYTFFTTTTVNGPGGLQSFENPVSLQIPSFLVVRPRINGDRTITMLLTPQIAGINGFTRSPSGRLEVPNLFQQTINVIARVRDRETIALAGLTQKNDSNDRQKFPILGDLPIIGQFFQSNSTQRSTSDLLIFVTPTIVDDEEFESGLP